MAVTDRAKELLKRFGTLAGKRAFWLSHWEDLAWAMLPNAQGFTSTWVEGERRSDDIFDGTPMRAARGLANAIGGMLRAEGQRWFFLKAGDDDNIADDAGMWLADTEKRLMSALDNPKARFRQATGETDQILAVLGTAIMFIGEGKQKNHLLFQSLPLKDTVVFFDDEGNAEGIGHERYLAVHQLADMFGRDGVGVKARQAIADNKWDEKLCYVHMIMPQKEGSPDALLAKNLPWLDIWIEKESGDEVATSGFQEFPCAVPRWDTSSGEDYGRSPAMIALPDAMTLQAMGETFLIAGQRLADPPLMAPGDGTFSELNMFPGGVSYYDVEAAKALGTNPVYALDTRGNLPLTREMQMDIRDGVFNAFFKNILNLPADGPQMTATEVMQRKEEFIREIGPVFGRLETDYTAPMVERAFRIMLRAGAFLPIPPSLAGRNVRFEYQSPVKKIRQQIEATAARLFAIDVGQTAQISPGVIDLVDWDEYVRLQADANSLPEKLLLGEQKVEEIRRKKAAAQQQLSMLDAAKQASESARNAAPLITALGQRSAA